MRWAEHESTTSSAQTYQVQIGQSEDFNIVAQVSETAVLLLHTHTHTNDDDDNDDDVLTE